MAWGLRQSRHFITALQRRKLQAAQQSGSDHRHVQENHLVTPKDTVVMEGLPQKQERSQLDVSKAVIDCCPTIWFGV